ncbi:unnamed protein product, partial [Arctogadus glacialis]
MANADDHDLPGLGFLSCSLSVVVYCSVSRGGYRPSHVQVFPQGLGSGSCFNEPLDLAWRPWQAHLRPSTPPPPQSASCRQRCILPLCYLPERTADEPVSPLMQMREEPEVQETLGPVGCVVTCLKCEKRGGPGQPSPPPHERTPESIQLPGRLQLS